MTPALIVGLLVFTITIWRINTGDSTAQIWQTIKDLWHEFGKSDI